MKTNVVFCLLLSFVISTQIVHQVLGQSLEDDDRKSAQMKARSKYKGHQLTVYAEEGQPFYLVLNGVRQNMEPLPSVKVVDLTDDRYNARIVFEDEKLPSISKTLELQGVQLGWNAVVYPIVKGKKGNLEFPGMFSTKILFRNLDDPNAMASDDPAPDNQTGTFHYTRTKPNPIKSDEFDDYGLQAAKDLMDFQLKMMQTMTGKMDFPNPGMNNNPLPSKDPIPNDNSSRPQAPLTGQTACSTPMANNAFASYLRGINARKFDSDKVKALRAGVRKNCYSTQQAIQLLKTVSFESSRLEVAKALFPRVTDKENFNDVLELFKFSSSQDELTDLMDGGE